MKPTYLLILTFLLPFSRQNAPETTIETTNAYLRSFLPWWPKTDDFTLRTASTIDNLTQNATDNKEELEGSGNGNEKSAENEGKKEDVVDASTLRVHDLPASPLDELSPAANTRNLASSHDGNFIINFDEMSECPRDCSTDLREALGIVLQEMSHIERYHRICEKYKNASTCVNEDPRCNNDDRGMFEMMTSGFNYMCVEQELAFNATIKCIDDEAGLVQSECENQCQTKNMFMNWIMRGTMQNTIQQGVNEIVGAATGTNPNPLAFLQAAGANGQAGGGWADMLGNIGNPPNPETAQQGFENFRQFTNDLCRIGDCMLDCIRSKFNTRCEGSAGTLLSEVFVRPIAASQNKLQMLRPVMGMFMPEQCAYLHSNSDLQKHRIGSTMDEELKRMYAEKAAKEVRDKATQDELLSNLVPLDKNGVPLPRSVPGLDPIDSPLDVSVKTLDQLILDMYSKNETEALNISEKNNVTATFFDEKSEDVEAATTTSSPVLVATKTDSVASESNRNVAESSEPDNASGETSGESSGALEASGVQEDDADSSGASGASGELIESSGTTSGETPDASGLPRTSEDVESSGASGESSGYSNDDIPLLMATTKTSEEGSGVNVGEASGVSANSEDLVESSGSGISSGEGSGESLEASGKVGGYDEVFESSFGAPADSREASAEYETSGSSEEVEDLLASSGSSEASEASGSSRSYDDIFESSGASGDVLTLEGSSEDVIDSSRWSTSESPESSGFHDDVFEQSGSEMASGEASG